MKTYLCPACGYKYTPEKGEPGKGIKPGTDIKDIPDDLGCSLCGVDKEAFEKIDE